MFSREFKAEAVKLLELRRWLYVAAVLDQFSRPIVGRTRPSLVMDALMVAVCDALLHRVDYRHGTPEIAKFPRPVVEAAGL
jgi:transposase InsO family protein